MFILLSMETIPVSIFVLFCWLSLDENELAVLTEENNLYYGSLGIQSSSLIKVGKIPMLLSC